MHLHQAAEEIRNGILQKSFSLRRTFEVALNDTAPGSSLNSQWLKTLEDLHTEFGLLSDRLSPPGLEDGLPLAIHYQSQQWQADYSDWEFKLDLPDQWMVEPCDRSRVILTALDELLRSTLCDDLPDKCVRICLTFEPPSRKLSVQIPTAQTGEYQPQSKFVRSSSFSDCFLGFDGWNLCLSKAQQSANHSLSMEV